MRTIEKLTDTLDGKLLDFNFKIIGLLATIFLRPLATCTQVVFRKNLGERYFSVTTMIYAFFLWCIPSFLFDASSFLRWNLLEYFGWNTFGMWLANHSSKTIIGFTVGLLFWICASNNLSQARQRQMQGIPWYSMSRGESRLGSEDQVLNGMASIGLGILLFLFAPSYGVLYFASRFAGYVLFIKEQQMNYARYLDEMDAKILSGHFETALIGQQQPRQTQGLYCPLPSQIKGERRVAVAKVSATVLTRSAARTHHQDENTDNANQSTPAASLEPNPQPPAATAAKTSRIPRYVILGLIALGLIFGGVKILSSKKILNQSQITAQERSQVLPQRSIDSSGGISPDSQVDANSQKLRDREKIVDKLNNLVSDERTKLSKFRADFDGAYVSNANALSKSAHQLKNNALRSKASDFEKKEDRFLANVDKQVADHKDNLDADFETFLSKVERGLVAYSDNRNEILAEFQALADEIANTSKTGEIR